jgi:hypothetical protein
VDLPANPSDWPPPAKEDYEERAAILEYEANMPRADAEREAERLTREKWRQA